jgi:hypothetical protein
MVMNLFERLAQNRPAQTEPARKAPPSELEAAQKLLDFLQRWNRPTVSVRDIRIWGPRITRNRKNAIAAAEILVKNNFLVPNKPYRPHTYEWKIVRKPVIHPSVAIVAQLSAR